MKPAGLDNAQGVITALYAKDPTDPQYVNDKDFQDWKAFMAKNMPNGNLADASIVVGCLLLAVSFLRAGAR